MEKIIYVDFDGVLVNTPKYIKKNINNSKNKSNVLKNLPWDKLLNNCSEINNNIDSLKRIAKEFNVVILTHVYSEFEAEEKRKYINKHISDVDVITVPYYINKNDAVNPKNNILIDDYEKNIINWNNSGGIGILFNNTQEILVLLNNLERRLS